MSYSSGRVVFTPFGSPATCTVESGEFPRLLTCSRIDSPFQRPSGFVPCCVDRSGPDWLVEHDSHGQLVYGVRECFRFTGDRMPDGTDRFDDAQTWRRQEFNLYVEKKGVFTINAGYDFQANSWVDNYIGVETHAGRFRLGQFKTPVGWEDGNTSTGNVTFLERSLPEQAVHEGRRVGIDWLYQGIAHWLLGRR